MKHLRFAALAPILALILASCAMEGLDFAGPVKRTNATRFPAPTGLKATAGNASVSLGWTALEVDSYKVTCTPGSAVTSSSNSAVISGLTNGTRYTFVVSAVGAFESVPSGEVTAVPIGLSAVAGRQQATLTWTAVAGATYQVYQAEGESVDQTGTKVAASMISGSSATVTGLTNGTTYSFVVATSSAQDSPGLSNTVSVTPSAPHTLVAVQGGSFNRQDSLQQNSMVTISSFQISTAEVTRAQFFVTMGSDPTDTSRSTGKNDPVSGVTWEQAVKYCNQLSRDEGKQPAYSVNAETGEVTWDKTKNGYRLPTEAEWEFAARGGTKTQGYTYSGSNNNAAVAWTTSDAQGKTKPVAQKAANELGLYDMSGNAPEWCWDWYESDYPSGPQTNPDGEGSINKRWRVLRGGSWGSELTKCQVDARGGDRPFYGVSGNIGYGFRIATN